ncbi:hypothetical protein QP794_03420 [Paenibacillus sp. UMB7766-LJ446]|uniref:hypothetical protein n=1 Tax=Paenibacillus sp. UMB7766-LJ446 TaxID=3046313 RepID=UPI00254CE439|nr:hypothetical protein [Paenibacillus sp. UMB7766-LJ446]MDK8189131.1 hypothetical protein [Paenibacillus sp. UMB7766-LJ446]
MKAIFLDFYGTVVHEDDDILPIIHYFIKMDKHWLDNSTYNRAACQEELEKILKGSL